MRYNYRLILNKTQDGKIKDYSLDECGEPTPPQEFRKGLEEEAVRIHDIFGGTSTTVEFKVEIIEKKK